MVNVRLLNNVMFNYIDILFNVLLNKILLDCNYI